MILRILGEGQLDVPDTELDGLNKLDDQVEAAVAAGDEALFRTALESLLARVHEVGTPLPDDTLVTSGVVLPPADASLDEVREMLDDDGLVPG